jgi:hypothetical protein
VAKWYHFGMGESMEKVTTNIRQAVPLMARVDRYAARLGLSRNAAIAVLLDRGLAVVEADDPPAT